MSVAFLSRNFTVAEMIQSQTAARLGLDNTPSPEVLERLKRLVLDILEPARDALGPLRVSSGYRSPAVNAAVGGSSASDHMTGDAADIIPIIVPVVSLARWITQNRPWDQLIFEYGTLESPAWLHISNGPRMRRQVLRILAGTGYESVTL